MQALKITGILKIQSLGGTCSGANLFTSIKFQASDVNQLLFYI
jgi:hypothetical protein